MNLNKRWASPCLFVLAMLWLGTGYSMNLTDRFEENSSFSELELITNDTESLALPPLACNDNVQVSLDGECEALITPDMILEGADPVDPNDYTVTTSGGNPIYGPGTFVVTVTEVATGNSCWSTIVVEDNLPPVLECDCPEGEWLTNPDCTDDCTNMDRYLSGTIGKPYAEDNCEDATPQFGGASHVEIECGVYLVTQEWYVSYATPHGTGTSTITCTNQYYLTSVELDDVDCPSDVEYSCTDLGGDNLFHPDNTGYPELDGMDLDGGSTSSFCSIFAGYDDVSIPSCGAECAGPEKILRNWTIINWCTGDIKDCQQIIKVTDVTPPTIQADDVVVSTDPWKCSADVWFDDPLLHDDCTYDLDWYIASTNSGAILVDENGSSGSNAGPKKHALNVPKGYWEFTLASTDCCGNTGYYTVYVEVKDQTPPVAVATQNIVVSLTSYGNPGEGESGGLAKIFSTSINNGSHDNCSDVWVEIRRDSDACGQDGNDTYSDRIPEACDPWYSDDDEDYGDSVKFCCDDLTDVDENTGVAYGVVKVWMRVWDDGNVDGHHGSYTYYNNPGNDHDYCDIHDNYNETWVHVRVEDKAPIQLICPPDINIECHKDWTDLELTGYAHASGSCSHPTPEYVDWPNIHCGEGYILREWFVPGYDYVCVQRITLIPIQDDISVYCPTYQDFENIDGNPDPIWIDPYVLNHLTVDCADFEFPEPTQVGGKCSLIGVSSQVDTFWFEAEACFKAIKKWYYIDWCNEDEWECDFVVSVVDTEAPSIACQDTCFGVNDFWDEDEDGNTCELTDDVEVHSMAMDSGDCGSEWIKWVVKVDYWFDGIVDEEFSSFIPSVHPDYVAPTLTGSPVYVDLDADEASAEWARHAIEWKAFDGCGNVSSCTQYVEVTDKKAPTPYCVGISTALMSPEAGELVEIWAKDFNLGSFDNCTDQDRLRYTFGEVPPVLALINEDHCFEPVWEDRENCIPLRDGETGLIVSEVDNNCNNYEDGATRPECPIDGVQKWDADGIDEEGNPCVTSGMKFKGQQWCGENDIRISVWDNKLNTEFCWVTLIVHGTSCDGGATSRISGQLNTETGEAVEGAMVYKIAAVDAGSMMTDVTGIYFFDQNIMGADYAISAEKDNEYLNGVSTLDLVMIQQHVLGITTLNSGYKLVAADINSDETVSGVDLIELRKLILGIYTEFPVNTSWRFIDAQQPLNIDNPWPINEEINISNLTEDRMNENFVSVKVGDVNGSAVANAHDIKTENRSNGYLDLVVETVGNTTIVKAGSDINNLYGFQMTMSAEGALSSVTAGQIDITDENFAQLNEGLITTSFASAYAIDLNAGEVLFTLNDVTKLAQVDGLTKAESYVGDNISINVQDVQLRAETNAYNLMQNQPNPFSEVTNISFTLGQAGYTTLTVYDVTGKVIKQFDGNFEKGSHTIQLTSAELSTRGIVYYQLESGDFTATKKMIIIE